MCCYNFINIIFMQQQTPNINKIRSHMYKYTFFFLSAFNEIFLKWMCNDLVTFSNSGSIKSLNPYQNRWTDGRTLTIISLFSNWGIVIHNFIKIHMIIFNLCTGRFDCSCQRWKNYNWILYNSIIQINSL